MSLSACPCAPCIHARRASTKRPVPHRLLFVPPIEVAVRQGEPGDTQADTRVCGLFDGGALTDPDLQKLVDAGEARGTLKRLCVTHEDAGDDGRRRVIIAGLGKEEEFTAERARVAAAAATRAKELGAESLSWSAPEKDGAVGGIVEGTLLSLYDFDRFKSSKDENDDNGGSGLTS